MRRGADAQLNQYTTTPLDDRTYDANGNLRSRVGPGGGAPIADLIYDYRNQMVRYVSYDTVQVHVYHYDAFGRRIAKIVDAAGANDETRYFYGGENFDHVIEEQTDTGSVRATYVYGEYIDEVIEMDRAGSKYYFHCDDLYNVMAATDASGVAAEAYSYSDYGDPTILDATHSPLPGQASQIGNPYRFTGRRFDEESGLYWYRSRYYDPVAGRFTSRDTIGLWGDPTELGNGYAYVGNNPWTYVDPTGKFGIFGFEFNGEWADNFWGDVGKGAAATGDGFIPYVDPFKNYYDPKTDRGTKWSKRGGKFAYYCIMGPRSLRNAKNIIQKLRSANPPPYVSPFPPPATGPFYGGGQTWSG